MYFLNKGITDPLEFITLPYLTTEKIIFCAPAKVFADIKSLSAASFVAPYKLIGLQALSVDKAMTFFIFFSKAAKITFSAPYIFVLIHS